MEKDRKHDKMPKEMILTSKQSTHFLFKTILLQNRFNPPTNQPKPKILFYLNAAVIFVMATLPLLETSPKLSYFPLILGCHPHHWNSFGNKKSDSSFLCQSYGIWRLTPGKKYSTIHVKPNTLMNYCKLWGILQEFCLWSKFLAAFQRSISC